MKSFLKLKTCRNISLFSSLVKPKVALRIEAHLEDSIKLVNFHFIIKMYCYYLTALQTLFVNSAKRL